MPKRKYTENISEVPEFDQTTAPKQVINATPEERKIQEIKQQSPYTGASRIITTKPRVKGIQQGTTQEFFDPITGERTGTYDVSHEQTSVLGTSRGYGQAAEALKAQRERLGIKEESAAKAAKGQAEMDIKTANLTPEQIAASQNLNALTPEQMALDVVPNAGLGVRGAQFGAGGLKSGIAGAGVGAGIGAAVAAIPTLGLGAPVGAAIGGTIGGIAGFIGGGFSKISSKRNEDITEAYAVYTQAKQNQKAILRAANSGIDPTILREEWIKAKADIYSAERNIKQENQGFINKFTGKGKDKAARIDSYIGQFGLLDQQFETAVLYPNINLAMQQDFIDTEDEFGN